MQLFSTVNSYLGVDIGTTSVKIVELESYKGQAKLKTYGYADINTNILSAATEKNNQLIADYIKHIVKKARIESRQAIAALPTFSVFTSIISLPPMPKKDLSSAIKWEAKKFIPLPIEEMILDWKILNKKEVANDPKASADLTGKLGSIFSKKTKDEDSSEEDSEAEETAKKEAEKNGPVEEVVNRGVLGAKNYRILLTAAPKNLVARYLDIFKRTNLNLLSLETEAFALSRSLMGNDMSSVMIVDIGANNTDVCVIEEGVPILNRGIDTGGNLITKSIMNSMNVNVDRAEQFKRDFGLTTVGNRSVPNTIQNSLNPIINEIKYVFDLYQRQGESQIEKIILAGGSSFLPNLPKYLSELLGLPVIIGDPWDRIVYPLDLKPVLQEIGPRMAASIGLAMRDI
ncbi:pilus assembly protein PilM [Candidatus Nomurabacteria bacterium]|nr:pilus assembly protein PilM [Candidatus Nomurabacteria bacterium]